MKKESPTSSDSSLHDPPGYIEPSQQDLLLTDITVENLPEIARSLGVEYLSPVQEFPGQFPIQGRIYGDHRRFMINLVCRRLSLREAPAVNIVFLVDTGSPVSYLSKEAMEALIGNRENMPSVLDVFIHSERAIPCHLSPSASHFADVNVLGTNFLAENELSLAMQWRSRRFNLH
ncbi:hypothetical protein MP638_000103 [Amoeboaphelidium occidentale]|nr:hypothetical protein MP638_000103 [Amoeboaphelidium occidentale]